MSAIAAQPVGNEAAQGGISGLGFWRYRTEIVAPPASGQIRFDNADPELASEFYLHEVNSNGTDVSGFLALVATGAVFYIQLQGDSGRYIIVEVGLPVDQGVYWEFPITQIVQNGTDFNQNNSVGVFVTQPGAGLATTLQAAYNAAPGVPQISVNATPDPVTIDATVAGDIFQVRSVANSQLFGISTTQALITDVPLTISGALSPAGNAIVATDVFTTGAPFIGGVMLSNGTIDYDNGVFIWALLQEGKTYRALADPGFAAFTLFNALSPIVNGGSFDLVQAIVLNAGVSHQRITAGTSSTNGQIGISFSPSIRAAVSGAVMNRISARAVVLQPVWNTNNILSVVDLGEMTGLYVTAASQQLFGQSLGTELIGPYYGISFQNITNATAGRDTTVVRSLLTAGADNWFLDNIGGATSDFGGGSIVNANIVQVLSDSFGISLGAAGGDLQLLWDGSQGVFNPIIGDNLELVFAAGSHVFTSPNFLGSGAEVRFGFDTFAFGQTGVVGNQVGLFVANTRTVGVAGGWSDFLLTQAGNVDLDGNAMSQVFGWTINAPSITLSGGSAVDTGALLLGGNVNQGTNRYGMLILSNPTGGTINEALRILTGRTRTADFFHDGTNLGFYSTTPIAQQVAVPVNIASVHAALVALGLIT